MSKYKVGDRFIVEVREIVDKKFPQTAKELYQLDCFDKTLVEEDELDRLQEVNPKLKLEDIDDMLAEHDLKKESYEKGLNDAWELARKVSHMCLDDMNKCFDLEDLDKYGADKMLYEHFTPQEALAKIEAYEESKAIKVGNVVFNAREDVKAVIMDNAIAEGAWQVYTENGCVELWKECEFKKTGKTVDIEHLLEQIRGNE